MRMVFEMSYYTNLSSTDIAFILAFCFGVIREAEGVLP